MSYFFLKSNFAYLNSHIFFNYEQQLNVRKFCLSWNKLLRKSRGKSLRIEDIAVLIFFRSIFYSAL